MEHEKLLHKYKREMKGAVREIRKDRAFLGKLKLKQILKRFVLFIIGFFTFIINDKLVLLSLKIFMIILIRSLG